MSEGISGPTERPRKSLPVPPAGHLDPAGLLEGFAHRMMYSVAKDEYTASDLDVSQAFAYSIRDRLMERWFATQKAYYNSNAKRVYYLSMEFLLGKLLINNILNLGALSSAQTAALEIGYRLEQLQENEEEPGLGNGGLGRLAACILESAATLSLPLYGYGIRYEYGIFRQQIEHGFQIEQPDNWLRYGNPWEIPRPDSLFPVRFYGRGHYYKDTDGVTRFDWVETEDVLAMAYDVPVIGYGNNIVNSLRLWSAKSTREFDLAHFNAGDYVRAVEEKTDTENISKVLYPPDDRYAGKELRLKQQYFFVSATLQDVIRRFKKKNAPWEKFPDHVVIQLNDTHPAVAIPELMRIFIDQEKLDWEHSWKIAQQVFGYTNHTVLPEALESWSTELMGRLLPRHLQIVEEIDRRLHEEIRKRRPSPEEGIRKMAIVDRRAGVVRMANLAIVGSKAVNGVARLHTEILKRDIFSDFNELYPGKFSNKTNGITPRRWLCYANDPLSRLITDAIGDSWIRDLDHLQKLETFATDAAFCAKWSEVKRQNKITLNAWLKQRHGISFDPDSLLDCQVKRIHEYKRQLLNVLRVIHAYLQIRDGMKDSLPLTVLFAGKAAPGYFMAKLIIKLINAVADVINGDPAMKGKLKILFVPNYSVSAAEMIFPACELSEQISTAGTEASGTGNMKAALNGALTVGTLDGANIEIREEVGEDNMFIFGLTSEEVRVLRAGGYDPASTIQANASLAAVIEFIANGPLHKLEPTLFQPIADALKVGDRYLHCADFQSYVDCQQRIDEVYRDQPRWQQMSIMNVAHMGKFSADRTVREYARDIWGAAAVEIDLEQVSIA